MSKTAELDALITELRNTAAAMNHAADTIKKLFSENDESKPQPQNPQVEALPLVSVPQTSASDVSTPTADPPVQHQEQQKPLTLPEVRAILAEKSKAGYTAQIKELLLKHGSDKLSGIDSSQYASLLAEAEVLGNG